MEKIYIGLINYASATPEQLAESACLDGSELERSARISHPQAKSSFLAGRALVRALAFRHLGIAPEKLMIRADSQGKPLVEADPVHHISISHSHNLACAAWAKRAVGLDIEFHRSKRQWQDIATRYYGPRENEWLAQATGDGAALFHDIWTLKEAWLKLSGQGLGGIAHSPQFLPDPAGRLTVLLPPGLPETPLAGFGAFRFFTWRLRLAEGLQYSLALAIGGTSETSLIKPEFDWGQLDAATKLSDCLATGWVPNPYFTA